MSVAFENKSDKSVYNLTQLKKNSRKRPDKYAGKKKPRPIDKFDANESIINPAPDSILNNTQLDNKDDSLKFGCTSTPSVAPLKKIHLLRGQFSNGK